MKALNNIRNTCTEHLASKLHAKDFHESMDPANDVKNSNEYWDEAERQINKMSNLELLQLIEEAHEE